jgi:hypothetical protein
VRRIAVVLQQHGQALRGLHGVVRGPRGHDLDGKEDLVVVVWRRDRPAAGLEALHLLEVRVQVLLGLLGRVVAGLVAALAGACAGHEAVRQPAGADDGVGVVDWEHDVVRYGSDDHVHAVFPGGHGVGVWEAGKRWGGGLLRVKSKHQAEWVDPKKNAVVPLTSEDEE